jgi:pimeloyl-ACP methyl ester carboxylesterase
VIGHELFGAGERGVIVLNDWLCDVSTWSAASQYVDASRFSWAFADLRGYGRSRGVSGSFAVEESAHDVVALADAFGWPRFSIVGHSMSSLVALHLAQHWPDRVERAVVIAPPPPVGLGADESRLDALLEVARGDDAKRIGYLRSRLGERASEGWIRFKAERWRSSSDPAAVAGYVPMFACRGLPSPAARIWMPLLAVTGEQDVEVMRAEAVTEHLSPISDRLVVVPLTDCGHYPMQEAPPLVVAIIERFLDGTSSIYT